MTSALLVAASPSADACRAVDTFAVDWIQLYGLPLVSLVL